MDQTAVNVERFATNLRAAVLPLTVELLEERFEDYRLGGPHTQTLGLDAPDGERRWLVTLKGSFVRDLHGLRSIQQLIAGTAGLILKHPRGCHVCVDIGQVGPVESRFTDFLAGKGEYAAVL